MRIRAKSESTRFDPSGICFDRSPLPVALLEGTGLIVSYANAAFCRLADKTCYELVGKAFAKVLPRKRECAALMNRVLRTGKSESYTEQIPGRSTLFDPDFARIRIGTYFWAFGSGAVSVS